MHSRWSWLVREALIAITGLPRVRFSVAALVYFFSKKVYEEEDG